MGNIDNLERGWGWVVFDPTSDHPLKGEEGCFAKDEVASHGRMNMNYLDSTALTNPI